MKKKKIFPLVILLPIFLYFIVIYKPPVTGFTYAEPKTKGYSPQKLELLRKHLIKSEASSMMIMVDGAIIFEYGETKKKHLIHSIRKALLNSLIGIAVEQGKIDTSLTLKQMGINDIEPRLSEQEQQARIIDLLKSKSGVYHDAAAVSEGMLRSKPERYSYAPGEHYYYNNWDFNTLGAILEMQTGESIYDLFNNQIAIPLGMKDYKGIYSGVGTIPKASYTTGADVLYSNDKPKDPNNPFTSQDYMPNEIIEDSYSRDGDGFYQYEKENSKYPAYHFRMSARDLILYGQLYLNYGAWDGKQMISKAWIDASTKSYSIINPQIGMGRGLLWDVITNNDENKRNSFFHTGAGMHCLGVYPGLDMVFVHRVDTESGFSYNEGDFYTMLDLLFDARGERE